MERVPSAAKEGAEKVEEQVAGAEARIDSANVNAGTEVSAYPVPVFFSILLSHVARRALRAFL
jgi:hypothetical protein